MKTLIEIYEAAKTAGTCYQINFFKKAIDEGNEKLAWSIALRNADWLKRKGITTIEELFTKTNVAISYYPNGQVWVKSTYQNGVKHGEYVSYYLNGQVMEKYTYQNGVIHGEFISYYNNGQVMEKYTYQNGWLHGECVRYCDNGQVYEKIIYIDGERQ